MHKIKVFRAADGRIAINPEECTTNARTASKRFSDAIMEAKKNPSACANMQKGESSNDPCKQDDSKPKLEKSQELFRQLDQEEQKEAVRFMRELIGSKA